MADIGLDPRSNAASYMFGSIFCSRGRMDNTTYGVQNATWLIISRVIPCGKIKLNAAKNTIRDTAITTSLLIMGSWFTVKVIFFTFLPR